MIKLFKDYTDFVWDFETNEAIEELGLDPIPVGTMELRDGREVRITEDDEEDEDGFMVVVFDGAHVSEYNVCDSKEEVNKFLIELQRKRK